MSIFDRPRVSVILPCYNEAPGLALAHTRIAAACHAVVGDSYEIVMVNDGSTDATWAIIKGLADSDDRLVGINLSRNFGQQVAVAAGLANVTGQRVLLIDADLQDPPELLSEMMAKMDEGYDVVYGVRRNRDNETWFKKKSSKAFYRVFRWLTSDESIPVDTGDFRLMTRRVVDAFNSIPEQHRYTRGLLSWIGFKQVGIKYDRDARFAGKTSWSVGKLVRLSIDAITAFSMAPLRFASHLGFLSLFASLGFFIYTLYGWLNGYAVYGWTSLMATIVFFGSVQLFVLGIIGEYLGRVLIESKRRPLFFIESVVSRGGRRRTSKNSRYGHGPLPAIADFGNPRA